jgi:MFS transporter, ACS family, tartrate transporter
MKRLIPFMIFLFILNYLDRVNISFAKLQMSEDLGFSDSIYGFGVSIFFIGYCVFEVPSNLLMERLGARIWIARIMITWGVISVMMMFIKGAMSFYILRFLLGVAEAGFFPGMILYLTYWVPAKDRAQAVAWFLTSTAFSGVIGGPLAAGMLKLDDFAGLTGWQWLFLIEGSVTVLAGFIVLLLLADRPKDARWLTLEERTWLTDRLDQERRTQGNSSHAELLPALREPKVWWLSTIAFLVMFGFYGIQYWTPALIKSSMRELSTGQVGMLATIPFLAGAVAMVLIARRSDRTGDRLQYISIFSFVAAIGFLVVCAATSVDVTIIGLAIAAVGVFGTMGPFWALPGTFLQGTAAAAGIALINSFGNLGSGFLGPNIMGMLKEKTNSYVPGVLVFSAALFFAALLSRFMRAKMPQAPTAAPIFQEYKSDLSKGRGD